MNSDQCFVPKETSFSGYDSRPHEAKNSAQDLSDGSRSLTDMMLLTVMKIQKLLTCHL